MDVPDFLSFTPVALRRVRADGWTPDAQRRFVAAIGRGASVVEAARTVGLSRQTAHALRTKPGATEFAAAWDQAAAFARRTACIPARVGRFAYGVETLLVPRTYRGRLIGFTERPDIHGAMRALGQLDRILVGKGVN